MSCLPGKVQVLGVTEILKQKVLSYRMIQGRNPDWIAKPFFSEYDENASWYTDIKPAFGEEKFFFKDELDKTLNLIYVENMDQVLEHALIKLPFPSRKNSRKHTSKEAPKKGKKKH